jgi:predicted RNA-binding Zn-ribbon protein involved in translation (DUF1610 family)
MAIAPDRASADVAVSVGKVQGSPGKEVVVPISIKGVKDDKVSALSVQLTFDPKVLNFKEAKNGKALPSGAVVDASTSDKEPGQIGLGFICAASLLEAEGEIVNMVFTVNSDASFGAVGEVKLGKNLRVLGSTDPPREIPYTIENGEVKVVAGSMLGNIPDLWLYIAIGVGGFLVLLLLIAFSNRRSERPRMMHPQPGYGGGGGAPRFNPEGGHFTHTCVKCGGVIQLPAAMRGQMFQCGACGTTQIAGPPDTRFQ